MSEELAGQALHDRAAELEIEGRSSMGADELRAAVAKAEKAEARAEAKEAAAKAEAKEARAAAKAAAAEAESVVQYDPTADSPQFPATPPTPTTGVADTTRDAASNEPSSPNVELPQHVHDNSGGVRTKISGTNIPAGE